MIQLRCQRRMHGELDPENLRLVVKCSPCTNAHKRPVFHSWSLIEIMEHIAAGQMGGICSPDSPQWVHWVVT